MTRRPHRRASARRFLVGTIAVAVAVATSLLGGGVAVGQIEAQRAEVRELEGQLIAVESEALAAAATHAEAERRVGQLRQEIAENTRRITQARKAHRLAQERLAARLVAIYTEREQGFVDTLLTSGDLSAAADAQAALETIGAADRSIRRSAHSARTRLSAARVQLVNRRAEAQESVRTQEAALGRLNALIGQRRVFLSQSRARLGSLITAEQQRQAQLAALAVAQSEGEADLRRQAAGGAPATPAGPAPAGGVAEHLTRIAQCESGGDPSAVSSTGQYRGKYQFDPQTWRAVGGSGDPAAAPEAEQDRRAADLYRRSGWYPWPVCGRQ